MRAADLFAGFSGAGLGLQRAGMEIAFAANHWPEAIDVSRRHFPDAIHVVQDLSQADFTQVPDVDLIWASPCCTGHSNAGQGARGLWGLRFGFHDDARATCWAVIAAAEVKRSPWIVVENVPQLRRWELFKPWLGLLEALGYQLDVFEADAADYGVPQERRRLFVVGRHGAAPRVAERMVEPQRGRKKRPTWTPMTAALDWDAGTWEPIEDKGPKLQERCANARDRWGERCLSQDVTRHPGRPVTWPLPTVTGQDQLRLVRGDETRRLTVEETLAAQGLPTDYVQGVDLYRRQAIVMAGNAVPPPLAQAIGQAIIEESAA